MAETDLAFPVVNINGTSREALIAEALAASEALHKAIGAMIEMAPHGRDYQTAAPGAYERARAQHRERILKVEGVRAEIVKILERLDEDAPRKDLCPDCGAAIGVDEAGHEDFCTSRSA